MSTQLKLRIEQMTDKLATAGLAGADMTTELRKLASAEDLSANEIRRIAEAANRRVQLGLYKVATDKRFKFKLADGQAVASEAAKTAANEPETTKSSEFHTRLDAIDTAGGDPFASPVRSDLSQLSLFNKDVDVKVASAAVDQFDAELAHKLNKASLTLEAILKEAQIEESGIKRAASEAHDRLVQSAVNLISHGVTLPSLYDAMIAGASGANSDVSLEDAVKHADSLMNLVLGGLKTRGIENHKMGFRHNGDPDALSKLSAAQLIALCKRQSSYQHAQDLSMRDVKTAELVKTADSYLERYSGDGTTEEGTPMRPQDALELLKRRSTQNGQFAVPQAYLDDADPYINGKLRVFNTNDEFIISVRDLVGAQDRMRRCHGAQEYLGLKLKKLEEASRAVSEARKTSELSVKEGARKLIADVVSDGQEKEAFIGPIIAGVGRALSGGLGRLAASAPVQALGTAGRQASLAYRQAVPVGARNAISKTVEIAGHPAVAASTMALPLLSTPKAQDDQ